MTDAAQKPWLYEYLFRGQPPGSTEPSDYHAILAVQVADAFGSVQTVYSQAMTPAQAAAAGVGMPDILAGMNTAVMAENDSLKAQAANLQASLDTAAADKMALQGKLDIATAAITGLQGDLAASSAAKDDLQAKLDAVTKPPTALATDQQAA